MDGDDLMSRIPPGVQFMPTDEELLKYYLMPMLMGQPPPCEIVREAEVYEHHPQDLLGTDHIAYFFTSRNRKYPNGKRPDRKASGGFWKASSGNKDINVPNSSVIGHERVLAYHMNNGTPKGRKTDWLMIEYTIPCSHLPLQEKKLDTWVICKLYVHNREKNQNGSGDASKDQAIGSSSHSVDHEDAKGPTEIDNLLQDMVISEQVEVLPNFSNHTNEQVYMPCDPSYASRGMVMPNHMPLQPVAQTAQDGSSNLNPMPLDSQPPVDLTPLPSSFTGCAEAGPSTSYANAAMLISTPPPDCSTTLPGLFDSELLDLSRNYMPPAQIESCDPSRHCQGHPDSQPLVALPSPPLPFTECVEAAPSTSHAGAVIRPSTPPPDLSTFPLFSDLEWQEIFEVIEGNRAPLQSVLQTAHCGNSRLNQGSLDSQPPIALPSPPSPFTECVEVAPSTSHAGAVVRTSTPLPDLSTFPLFSDLEWQKIFEVIEGNHAPLQLVPQTAHCDHSRLSQAFLDSQSPIALPSPPSPFTGYAEAGPSSSHTSAAVPISAPPPDFSTTLPSSFDSRLPEISEDLEGNDVPLQSATQTTQYDPSRLS